MAEPRNPAEVHRPGMPEVVPDDCLGTMSQTPHMLGVLSMCATRCSVVITHAGGTQPLPAIPERSEAHHLRTLAQYPDN